MIKSITGHFKHYVTKITLQVIGSRVLCNRAGDCDEKGCELCYILPGKQWVASMRDCMAPNSLGLWAWSRNGRYCCTTANWHRPHRTTWCPKGHFNSKYSDLLFWTLTLVIFTLHKRLDLRKMNAKRICSLFSSHINPTGSTGKEKK